MQTRASILCGVVGAAVAIASTAVALGARQSPLQTYHFKASEIPAPTTSSPNPPKVVPKPADAALVAPPGFTVAVYADGFKRPRMVAVSPDGAVFVAESAAGSIIRLHDANGNQQIEEGERTEYATGLKQPFGMAFANKAFYVAATDAVHRFDYTAGQAQAGGQPTKIADLPSGPTGHWTRNLRFTDDGASFLVTVGSSSDHDPDADPLRATVLRFRADGSNRQVVATGVRNAIGLDLHPKTKDAWMAVQERESLGDDVPPDYVTQVKEGAFYGFPYAYAGPNEEPRHKGARPDLVQKTVVPDVIIQPHSAIMDLRFYTGGSFPAKYRDGAFAALRGSSGRSKRTGYKIIFLPFPGGRPTGGYEDFVVGWMLGEDKPEVWGRPVGLAIMNDGSLLVTDDAAGKIWRVSYK